MAQNVQNPHFYHKIHNIWARVKIFGSTPMFSTLWIIICYLLAMYTYFSKIFILFARTHWFFNTPFDHPYAYLLTYYAKPEMVTLNFFSHTIYKKKLNYTHKLFYSFWLVILLKLSKIKTSLLTTLAKKYTILILEYFKEKPIWNEKTCQGRGVKKWN